MSYTIIRNIEQNTERVEKLPAWAKEHIRNLERHASQCENELNRVMDDQTVRPISFTSNMLNIGQRKYIPADAVRYVIGENEIEIRLEDDCLHVMLTTGGRLVIKPCVTNVVDIHAER